MWVLQPIFCDYRLLVFLLILLRCSALLVLSFCAVCPTYEALQFTANLIYYSYYNHVEVYLLRFNDSIKFIQNKPTLNF